MIDDLLQFLANKGGLAPHPELAALDAHRHLVEMEGFPPKRKLVKEGGMALDYAREAAEEAGYLQGEHDGTSTVRDLLDAIDEGMRGNHCTRWVMRAPKPNGKSATRIRSMQSSMS
jgi:hypothetical protein